MREFRFGDWRFEADSGELSNQDVTARLEPQVAKLLAFFLANQDRVISRDELIASVWDHRVVSDDAVNRCISILRQTLSPDDKNALIETLPRRGFIAHFPSAPDTQAPGSGGAPSGPAGSKSRRSTYLAAAVLLAITIVAAGWWFSGPDQTADQPEMASADEPPVVAVLPFATSGQSDDGQFFASGMHDDLLTQLAQIQSMRVISRTSVLEYRGSNRNLRDIGRQLGADVILEGSVQSAAGQIRINVQLIDASTDEHLWAQSYDRELTPENLFAVQSEIARSVASAMNAALTAQDASQLSILPTDNMAAYRAYHEAMDIRGLNNVNDPDYLAALERAVELDPEYVRAWAELAGILSFRYFMDENEGLVERVEGIIERIRTLAPDSGEHLIAQAYYTYYILRNYEQAYRLITKAQAKRPSDVLLLDLKSWIARRLGDFDGKIEAVRQAQMLDPRDPQRTALLVSNLMMAHRFEEASREIDAAESGIYELAFQKSVLNLRQHRDLERWADEVAALAIEFPGEADLYNLWDALIANREFAAAEALAQQFPEDSARSIGGWSLNGLPDKVHAQLLSGWFLQSGDQPGEQALELRRTLDEARSPNGSFSSEDRNLSWALLALREGDADSSKRAIHRWRREAGGDLAELTAKSHVACRLLGMVGAASEAVDCLREGLEMPSLVMPFMEPYLPYYDSIRDESVFVALVSELSP